MKHTFIQRTHHFTKDLQDDTRASQSDNPLHIVHLEVSVLR
jgi:hypothetical protein